MPWRLRPCLAAFGCAMYRGGGEGRVWTWETWGTGGMVTVGGGRGLIGAGDTMGQCERGWRKAIGNPGGRKPEKQMEQREKSKMKLGVLT